MAKSTKKQFKSRKMKEFFEKEKNLNVVISDLEMNKKEIPIESKTDEDTSFDNTKITAPVESEELNQYPGLIEEEYKFKIAKNQAPMRLDVFLTNQVLNATRTRVQRAFESNLISVNGQITTKPSRKVLPGDEILCKMLKYPPVELIAQDIPIEVVYEDDYLLVVNKPQGMVTHPGVGNRYGTLVNAVMFYLGIKDKIILKNLDDEIDFDAEEDIDDEIANNNLEIEVSNSVNQDNLISNNSNSNINFNKINQNFFGGDAIRPGVVHRLDKDTSGLLIISKNVDTLAKLQKQFATRTISRTYLALVWGIMPEKEGRIVGDIGRSNYDRKKFAVVKKNGKHAITDYKVIDEMGFLSLVQLKLQTGRTHQIRVHLSHNRHPIFGDESYGGDKIVYGQNYSDFKVVADKCLKLASHRQILHAHKLTFYHPNLEKTIELEASLNPIMKEIIELVSAFKLKL